jgi:hypothetical protein
MPRGFLFLRRENQINRKRSANKQTIPEKDSKEPALISSSPSMASYASREDLVRVERSKKNKSKLASKFGQ